MCVLDIIQRVFAVLTDRQIHVKLQMGVRRTRVEEEACRIDRHLVQQIGQRQGLAGTLGHTDNLAVLHHADELHQDDLQTVGAVQTDGIECAL